jgi:RNA polymerase-binding transcription factor DksA
VSTRRTVAQIRAAIDRLDAGAYGRCTRCGDAIGAARLEVLPYAETCIRCQSALERA